MTFQPRFAAFMASFGRTDEAFNTTLNRADFMAWIDRCIKSAPATAQVHGRVTDHDAFTAHCWAVARDDLLARFPA